jgi:hypothetical protein
MGGNTKTRFLSVSIAIVILGSVIFFYKAPMAETVELDANDINSYIVDWNVREETSKITDFVSKTSNYESTVSFETPNLKEITFNLSWIDDKAPFLCRFGLDTLTLEIITPDGNKLMDSAKSARKTKQGNIKITFPVNNIKPTAFILESENILEVGKQLDKKYFDYTWVDEEFIITVFVQVGEIRPLKRLVDNGNDFDLEIIYSYYHASITETRDSTDTEINGYNSFKETGYIIPPSMCPFCDGSAFHYPWCPYYEDPFDDDDWRDDDWRDDDDWWDDDWRDDDKNNDHENYDQGNTSVIPWSVVRAFIFFYILLFTGSMVHVLTALTQGILR